MGEGGFRRFCRVIAGSIAQESGEIRTVQTDLQPIVPKSDRLLGRPSIEGSAMVLAVGLNHRPFADLRRRVQSVRRWRWVTDKDALASRSENTDAVAWVGLVRL